MLNTKLNYSDLPFIASKNQFTKDINLVKDVSAIKQSIKNIIMTIRGERPFNVLFGGNPRNFLFDTLDILVIDECKKLIVNSIASFEYRIEIKDIGIEVSRSNANRINIIVVYTIPQLNIVDTVSVSLERTR